MPSSDTTADPARARILIVDDDDAVMEYLRACLAAQLEDAEITLYNSARLGRPGPAFDWDGYDVLLVAREGELLARVDSPYVVHVYDHGFTNAYGYIAMEFFGRGDLAQRMEQGFSPEDAVLCLYNIACGLDAIHRVGIMHRDLKPANVMFRGDGSMAIADFGLAKRSEQDLTLTATGVILGTPYCMSPEQTLGERADHRTDLYGAGVIFYEMLTGSRPFKAANLPMLLLTIQTEPAPPLAGELACFQPVLDRLLAKRPEDRYANAAELIAALTPMI